MTAATRDKLLARMGGTSPLIVKPLEPAPSAAKQEDREAKPEAKPQRAAKAPSKPVTKDVAALFWVARRLDYAGRIVSWMGMWIAYQAPRLHAILAAHAFGWIISPSVRAMRKATCGACPHRQVEANGFESCKKENCRCGKHPVANLKYKRTLAGYSCKDGRFNYHAAAKRYYQLKLRESGDGK